MIELMELKSISIIYKANTTKKKNIYNFILLFNNKTKNKMFRILNNCIYIF